MSIIGFDEFIGFRIKDDELAKLKKVVKKNSPEPFFNKSHFIRCAVIRELRKYDKNGMKVTK